MCRFGDATVFVMAAIPNPLFDVAGMAAGSLRFPLWRFLLAAFLGKLKTRPGSLIAIVLAVLGMAFFMISTHKTAGTTVQFWLILCLIGLVGVICGAAWNLLAKRA